MTPFRRTLLVIAGLCILMFPSVAAAQYPEGALDLKGAQMFAPADLSEYANSPEPRQGYFFSLEGLKWSISKPDRAEIGVPDGSRLVIASTTRSVFTGGYLDVFTQTNSHDNGVFEADFTEGERVEFGRIFGHHGWLFGLSHLNTQNQIIVTGGMDVVFMDPTHQFLIGNLGPDPIDLFNVYGPLPITFDDAYLHNRTKLFNVELMYVYRTHRTHWGGIFEWFVGGRYLKFDDRFLADARGGVLGDAYWDTRVENAIVGPQAGVRWFRTHRRWTVSTEGRFFGGFNRQNFYQEGTLASNSQPGLVGNLLSLGETSFAHDAHEDEWAPAAELRVDLHYQLTRSVLLRVGWTGYWQDGIARASRAVVYEVPHMGINTTFNREDVFIHGATLGIEINR